MFQLDSPAVFEVIRNNLLTSEEEAPTDRQTATEESSPAEQLFSSVVNPTKGNKKIAVVSIFGNNRFNLSGHKRAFQLSIDCFGNPSLFSDKSEEPVKVKEPEEPIHLEENSFSPERKSDGSPNNRFFNDRFSSPFNFGAEGGDGDGKEWQGSSVGFDLTKVPKSTVDGFYCETEGILFLHLNGAYDPQQLKTAAEELHSAVQKTSFIHVWSTMKSDYSRNLLLMFSLSHILILSDTGTSLDTSYLHLFRVLDAVRLEVKSAIVRALEGVEGLHRDWIHHGRLCSPRLLCLFEIESESSIYGNTAANLRKGHGKERQNKLEDEIYHILRKCRIITNVSANSLFAIPGEEEYVFLFDKVTQNSSYEDEAVSNIYQEMVHQACSNSKSNIPKSTSTSSAYRSSSGISIKHAFRGDPKAITYVDVLRKFKEFLMIHVRQALTKGFDDDSRRVAEYKHFFVNPTFNQWSSAFKVLNSYLITFDAKNDIVSEGLLQLDKYINVDSQYLENQCATVFPKIYALYQRGLPEFYSEQVHRIRLTQAMNAYLSISRGAGVIPWLQKLAEKCDTYWKRGRQQCEATSLFKHHCVNTMHRVAPENSLEIESVPNMDTKLPEMKHNTGSRMISYCDCGRRQGTREEPFTIREANYSFYQRLSSECCGRLEHYRFPLFVATTSNSELSLEDMLKILKLKSDTDTSITEDEEEPNDGDECKSDDLHSNNASQVMETELRQENTLEEGEDSDASDNEAILATDEDKEFKPSKKENSTNDRQPNNLPTEVETVSSDIEYLPGMMHSKTPHGLLPQFSSWSLVCLGSSSLYNHSSGVGTRQGFLSGTNFLLPWDVMVKAEAGVSKPIPRFIRGRRHSTGKPQPISDEFNVKVFIGLEYECHRGHRFFANDFEKIVNFHSGNSTSCLKEAAAKISNSDMPLYFKCPCKESRDGRTMIAQLLRIHVVTPKAPVHCMLFPRVQPAPLPCPIFFPGNTEPIKLTPSSYWVLRLPYCYVGDEIYVQPVDADISRSNGKLLKGNFSVIAMSASETKAWERDAL